MKEFKNSDYIAQEDIKDLEKRDNLIIKRRTKNDVAKILGILSVLCMGITGGFAYNFSANAQPLKAMALSAFFGISLSAGVVISALGLKNNRKLTNNINDLNEEFIEKIDRKYEYKEEEKALEVVNKIKSEIVEEDFKKDYTPYEEVIELLNTRKEVLEEKKQVLIAYNVYDKSQETKNIKEQQDVSRNLIRYTRYKKNYNKS